MIRLRALLKERILHEATIPVAEIVAAREGALYKASATDSATGRIVILSAANSQELASKVSQYLMKSFAAFDAKEKSK